MKLFNMRLMTNPLWPRQPGVCANPLNNGLQHKQISEYLGECHQGSNELIWRDAWNELPLGLENLPLHVIGDERIVLDLGLLKSKVAVKRSDRRIDLELCLVAEIELVHLVFHSDHTFARVTRLRIERTDRLV